MAEEGEENNILTWLLRKPREALNGGKKERKKPRAHEDFLSLRKTRKKRAGS